MLRRDGEYEIYRIQHGTLNGGWVDSNLDHFGEPKGFSADGACWQRTGVIGTFSVGEARDGLAWIREKNPHVQFRLVLVKVGQKTTVL